MSGLRAHLAVHQAHGGVRRSLTRLVCVCRVSLYLTLKGQAVMDMGAAREEAIRRDRELVRIHIQRRTNLQTWLDDHARRFKHLWREQYTERLADDLIDAFAEGKL